MKIVLNGCYGGFSLSYEAMYLYLQAKNKEAFFYADIPVYDKNTGCLINRLYKRITLSEINQYRQSSYIYCTTEDQGEVLDWFPKNIFSSSNLDRTDPLLITIVEVMGTQAASGPYAHLCIEELPAGTQYKIDNYDGMEELITKDDNDWKTAEFQYQSMQTQLRVESIWHLIKPETTSDPDLMFKAQ